jgi:hypothetical protein
VDVAALKEIARAFRDAERARARLEKAHEKAKKADERLRLLLSKAQGDLISMAKACGVTLDETPLVPKSRASGEKRMRAIEKSVPAHIEIDEATLERGRKRALKAMLSKGFVEMKDG